MARLPTALQPTARHCLVINIRPYPLHRPPHNHRTIHQGFHNRRYSTIPRATAARSLLTARGAISPTTLPHINRQIYNANLPCPMHNSPCMGLLEATMPPRLLHFLNVWVNRRIIRKLHLSVATRASRHSSNSNTFRNMLMPPPNPRERRCIPLRRLRLPLMIPTLATPTHPDHIPTMLIMPRSRQFTNILPSSHTHPMSNVSLHTLAMLVISQAHRATPPNLRSLHLPSSRLAHQRTDRILSIATLKEDPSLGHPQNQNPIMITSGDRTGGVLGRFAAKMKQVMRI